MLPSPPPKITNEILDKILQQHSQYKQTRHYIQKIYHVSQILNIHLKSCIYTGKSPQPQSKTHLQIQFTSPDERGTICMSIPLEKYQEVIFHSPSPNRVRKNGGIKYTHKNTSHEILQKT